MILRHAIATASVLTSLATPLVARDVIDAFQAKYTKLKSVSCTFKDASGITGSLKALKGGYYHIKLPDREVISDGKNVWNVMPSTRTVIINSYKPTSDDVSLDRVFFLMLNIYRPTLKSVTKQTSTIRLTAPREDAVIANIREADITLNKSNTITSVTITEDGTTNTWYLSKLALNRSIPATAFTYKVPSGWQTVDLR